jgi:RNA polymerase sigma-70 factor, ECF subfamily
MPWAGEQSFQEVIAAAGRGDEPEFSQLWRWSNPILLRFLRALAPADAEDLASEVWLSVAQGLRRFSGDERAFKAWLLTIARHRAVDAARRRSRRVMGAWPLGALDPAAEEDVAAEAMSRMELAAGLALVRSLPRPQAEVVALRVIAGLSVAETAAVVGKTEGAVRVLAHRALRQLKSQLPAQGRGLEPVTR